MTRTRNLTAAQTAELFIASVRAKKRRATLKANRIANRKRYARRARFQKRKRAAMKAAGVGPGSMVTKWTFERNSRELAAMGWTLCDSSAWTHEDRLSRGTPWPVTLGWCLATAGMLAWRLP